jgi:ribosomal protein L23
MMRSYKPYGSDIVTFRVPTHLSKPELKQYLMKLYRLPVLRVNTIQRQGVLKRNSTKGGQWRKQDYKKAIAKVEFDVEPFFQRHD